MLDTSMMGLKEIYDCQLKASFPMDIAGKTIEKGEPIAIFQSIQFGNIDEFKTHAAAKGGFNNRTQITWDSTKEIAFNFTQGIFSKLHLAILSNSDMKEVEVIPAPKVEIITTNDLSIATLKYTPILNTLFLYKKDGSKITDYVVNNKVITFTNLMYEDVNAVYDFEYTSGASNIIVGRRLLQGYMELCAKTRLKDDETGQTVTGIIRIPKLVLMSDLSMRLGKDVPPMVGNFKTIGYPVGSKGSEKVMDFILLNDDIDSDI